MPRSLRCIRWIACTILSVAGMPVMAAGLPWEIWESPARLASLDVADLVIEQSSHCPQGCRYDRSNAGPENPLDNPTPQRWLYRDGEDVVLFDERGPGALTRIWMTTGFGSSSCIDPAVRIRFNLDGNAIPALDLPLAALFDGSVPPFTPPLVANRLSSSGGFVSRVPITYAHSLRVTLSGADNGPNPCTGNNEKLLWYQFTAHRLAQGSVLASFSPSEDFAAWRAFLDHPGDDPWSAMLDPQAFAGVLAPGTSLPLASRRGTGWLRGIRLQIAPRYRDVIRLRISIDDETAVDMPVADFFASSRLASLPTQSLFVGQDSLGTLFSWWPMPYAQSLTVELVADTGFSGSAAISGSLAFDNAPLAADTGRFKASLADTCVSAGDIELLNEQGAGKIVGISVRYSGDAGGDRNYLEGDERIVLDGAVSPAWYGTGVEDFFDAGFYFDQGEFSSPFSGASEVDPDGSGTTAAYRIFATDPIIYARSIRWTQEAGLSPYFPSPMCARRVIYRYHRDHPLTVSYGRFEVGDAAQRQAHDWQPSPWAICGVESGEYSDEPPSSRTALNCYTNLGFTRFTFRPTERSGSLRLRRTFDAAFGEPGRLAAQFAAEVRVNGVSVGTFPPAHADRSRRWQEQEILLPIIPGNGELHFTVSLLYEPIAAVFGESAWELLGGWVDPIFTANFDGTDSRRQAQ
ncbi:MAG TPA: DUF2961 domain-containing protein [Dokdonella sp.]|uniref:DUF2961 domain-containing protein n=1 Tax=Dokdonella sp. TaxID=2291710 RepID=UPI002D7E7BEF|nr:DUF2961 domain-containing protein [Dokdonella sp.]HET9032200.1 DUF2961 domain-containing protein [Dokdonella sp.]